MPDFIPVLHGVVDERPDESDTVRTAGLVSEALIRLGYDSDVIAINLDLSVLERLAKRQPLTVFNLVEAIRGDGRLGHIACSAMDHLGLSYTGASEAAYYQSNSKLMTKAILRSAGLPTAPWWLGEAPSGCTVIVKSVHEHASYGLDQGSIVDGAAAASEIVSREARFGGQFFAEQYIDGREFNISLLETENGVKVLPIPEIRFDGLPEGTYPIVDYAAKWDESSDTFRHTVRAFDTVAAGSELAGRLTDLSLACWTAFGLRGYGRIDFRVGRADDVHILEVNANPSLAPDAGFAAALQQGGLDYHTGIQAIVMASQTVRKN
ncbi:MAG: hypothetical protein RIB43_00700 [Rhodospirillaceae bacterium]